VSASEVAENWNADIGSICAVTKPLRKRSVEVAASPSLTEARKRTQLGAR
jgi:hypothetical protein